MCGHYTKRASLVCKMAATVVIALLLLCAATAGAEDHVLCNAFTRITILSSKVFRAEYSPTGLFEDRNSLPFIYRSRAQTLNQPKYEVMNKTDWCNISTSTMLISLYKPEDNAVETQSLHSLKSSPMYNKRVGKLEQCSAGSHTMRNTDVKCSSHCTRVSKYPNGIAAKSIAQCCSLCAEESDCAVWILNSREGMCYLLIENTVIGTKEGSGVTIGSKSPIVPPRPSNSTDYFVKHKLQARSVGNLTTGESWSWHAGQSDSENLKGTLKPTPSADLAGCCSNPDVSKGLYDPKYFLEDGILSRSGFAVVDDSESPLVDIDDNQTLLDAWISDVPRVQGSADIYFFGCGIQYRECMQEFTGIAGPIALPPLSGLGVWWSRHWGDESGNKAMVDDVGIFSQKVVTEQVVNGYKDHNLPLHVLVLDMEWHEMMQPPTCTSFKGKAEWGGYTWNTSLFDPQDFLNQLHQAHGNNSLGIKLSLNYHPDSGIDVCQANYTNMAKVLGIDPNSNSTISDLDIISNNFNQTYVDAYFTYMIETTLVDIAWTDTPQATTWTNWLYVLYPAKRKNKRTINFSRYGGIGDHRKPTGFSGDTLRKWDTLAYEVWMTPRASNVGFGWWSHDIGGFSGGPIDSSWHTETPELFLRWLQFAVYSPIMRTHCRYCDQRIWTWSKYDTTEVVWYDAMSKTMYQRNALVPYIYTHAALNTYMKGESLLTPMYYDDNLAHLDAAYGVKQQQQYFFGRDFIVSPITQAVSNISKSSSISWSLWLPPNNDTIYYDWNTMEALEVGSDGFFTRNYTMYETPVAVRGGSVIPTRNMDSAYKVVADPLVWMLVPGAAEGSGSVYEDDGETRDFENGLHSLTTLRFVQSSAGFHVNISSPNGTFFGAPKTRGHYVTFLGVKSNPKSVLCDGQTLLPSGGKAPGYWLCTNTSFLIVACDPKSDFTAMHTIVLEI
eukprot:m.70990 g.70990  ORF g.70990 m.70990 type:complete len:948 (+) comp12190_c0_seq1:86-2929(+)